MSELLVERAKRAEREYYKTGDVSNLITMLMYSSRDFDNIPDFFEDIDGNPRTTRYRYNFVYEMYEMYIVGKDDPTCFPY